MMSSIVFKAFVYIDDNDNYCLCYDDCDSLNCSRDCFEAVVKIIPVFRDKKSDSEKDIKDVVGRLNKISESLKNYDKILRTLKKL